MTQGRTYVARKEREGLCRRLITFEEQISIEGINTGFKANDTLDHPSEDEVIASDPVEITVL